jgi:ABC-type polysaccharide/polyol phosphate export permease
MSSNNKPSKLPEAVHSYLLLNPFTFNFEQVRDVLNYGLAAFFAWAGLFLSEKTRKDSADVL